MKQNLFKYMMRRAGGIFLLAAACMGAFSSCSDDDDTLNGKLDKTNAEVLSQSVSSLSFTWKAIKNASQYAYELSDPDKNLVENGVTTDLAASFTNLQPNTTYQLKVWAYGAYGSGYETSEPIYLTATTPAVVKLGMPEVKVVTSGATTTASWKSVEHAKKYEYYVKLKDSDKVLESGTVTDTEVALYGLVGEYELGVKSLSTSEAYSDSEYDKVEFKVEKREVWRTVGTFNDGAGHTWKATIVAYSNDSYTILKWYGNEGYDFEFSVASDGKPTFLNAVDAGDDWYQVKTDATHYLTIHRTYHSSFSGNSTSGKMIIYNSKGKDITFTWPVPVTVDALVGTYSQVCKGSELFTDVKNWTGFNKTTDVTITKVDDKTIQLNGFFVGFEKMDSGVLKGTVDFSAKTITFAPQVVSRSMTFCTYNSITTPVVATFTDAGVISFSKWSLMYSNYSYVYTGDLITTLTKKK